MPSKEAYKDKKMTEDFGAVVKDYLQTFMADPGMNWPKTDFAAKARHIVSLEKDLAEIFWTEYVKL
jgi:hypothetical protein